jgi:hypothetical protein
MLADAMLMQDSATVTTETDATNETPKCDFCGAGPHPMHAGRCERGHGMRGNQLHRTHGAYSFRDRGDRAVADTLRQSADEMAAGIIADKGGVENLTTIQREFINQLRNLRIMADLLAHDLVARGLHTKGGRVRSSHGKLLETLDRLYRFAQAIGPGREPRQVPSLADYLRQAASPEEQG